MFKLFLLMVLLVFAVLAIMFDWLGAREFSMRLVQSLEVFIEYLSLKGDQFQALLDSQK
ncbi:hypothetical protein JX580_10590 [Thiomicrospira microaerophila]|uniref:hypothetical protein n=1 Tax=Thiomicrospira microaerophila TaxID=406020 RepID=UPI00201005DE|nr:hypothetical protein [Thiomicrospira microaerophila]UQB42091.1 hypothetical protein JX580_10590 [Thiomicrospira microaerophila]